MNPLTSQIFTSTSLVVVSFLLIIPISFDFFASCFPRHLLVKMRHTRLLRSGPFIDVPSICFLGRIYESIRSFIQIISEPIQRLRNIYSSICVYILFFVFELFRTWEDWNVCFSMLAWSRTVLHPNGSEASSISYCAFWAGVLQRKFFNYNSFFLPILPSCSRVFLRVISSLGYF